MRDDRAGYTLTEAMAALVVAGLLMLGLAALLALVARAATRYTRLASTAETERTAPAILDAELRVLTAADATFGRDSVGLRAFRGGGIVCARTDTGVTLTYDGVRMPEPEKDSLLVVWHDGEAAFAIDAIREGACNGVSALHVDATHLRGYGARPLVAFVFETGAYSLTASAFRYRRGAAGRQPLTEETLSSGSALRARVPQTGAALVDVQLVSRYADAAGGVDWRLALPQGASVPARGGHE